MVKLLKVIVSIILLVSGSIWLSEMKPAEKQTEMVKETKQGHKQIVWVDGKSLRECMGNEKTINNNTIQCQKGYFKEVIQ